MALVHRANDFVSPAQRASNNLDNVLRGERCRTDAILRYSAGLRNGHEDITEGPTGNSVEQDETTEIYLGE